MNVTNAGTYRSRSSVWPLPGPLARAAFRGELVDPFLLMSRIIPQTPSRNRDTSPTFTRLNFGRLPWSQLARLGLSGAAHKLAPAEWLRGFRGSISIRLRSNSSRTLTRPRRLFARRARWGLPAKGKVNGDAASPE